MELTVKKLDIEPEFIKKTNAVISSKKLDITYYNGYIVGFNKCNIESISPHKILVSNNEKNLLIVSYAEYAETEEIYYIGGVKEPFNLSKLKEYIKNYF